MKTSNATSNEGNGDDPVSRDVGNLREHYDNAELSHGDLDPDPIRQFDHWFREAQEADLSEPNAMVLATAGGDGTLTTRAVLLKAFDSRGFVFFTNYQSTKARQIAENTGVAMNFLWLPLQRQINITGTAEKVTTAESIKYFLSRPYGSQIGAWVSNQSSVISSRKILQMKYEELKRKFRAGKVPIPDHWGGFRVNPRSIEFWQGLPNRLHDRFRYVRIEPDGEWTIERLAP